jgi:hypothetical protein
MTSERRLGRAKKQIDSIFSSMLNFVIRTEKSNEEIARGIASKIIANVIVSSREKKPLKVVDLTLQKSHCCHGKLSLSLPMV